MPTRATAAEVVDAARALADHTSGTLFIGVDGFGGAGKSTLAAQLAAAVERAHVLHIDDLSGPNIAEWDWVRFHEQVLAPLRREEAGRYQVWNWARDCGGDWIDVPVGAVVIVEGVSSTRTEVDVDWAMTVWVEAPREVRLQRARARDGAALMHRWLDDWMPSEQAYAARERPWERVDYLVDGTVSDPGASLLA